MPAANNHMPPFSIRLMTTGDLAAADELRRLVGWNQTQVDWARMLALAPRGCFLAEARSEVVGSVTTTIYGPTLAWLGMMLVHPQYRRQGIGAALMRQALHYLKTQAVACVKLDATPAGFPLYTQLGFTPEWTLTRWQAANHAAIPPTSSQTRGFLREDWEQINAVDAAVLGVARSQLLRRLVQDSCASAVWPVNGRIAGWGLLRAGANALYLGPLVCSNPEGSSAVLTDLLAVAGNTPVFWDVPDQNEVARRLAEQFGFQPVRPLTRMRLGPNSGLGSPHAQLGIADPALG
jgi:GNAT superfamily N-acetyltransferase